MDVGEGSSGFPMRSDSDIRAILLSEDEERDQSEPGWHQALESKCCTWTFPYSLAQSEQDKRRVLENKSEECRDHRGGIGHLSAWLFDLWSPISSENEKIQTNRPKSLRIIDPGKKVLVIFERLIRRYEAGDWAQVVSMNWQEVIAETISSRASNVSIDESALNSDLPIPVDLVVSIYQKMTVPMQRNLSLSWFLLEG
ncbi:MAG: hypothetical protein Ct9H90mP24_7420 [Methanobacteriota archaeon]|nr:MAG: hypothetical protein Ct9H90mP24_7420 [Euryarchaeota archaeon]